MDPSTQLVAAVRALIDTVRTSDLAEAEANGVDLAELALRIQSHISELAPHVVQSVPTQIGLRHAVSGLGAERFARIADGVVLDIFPYSPITGLLNPVAPPMQLWPDGSVVRGSGRIPTSLNGPPAGVHGGFVAAVLDELLGAAAVVAGLGGFTGTLTVRYLKLTPLDTDLDLAARVEASEGRKVIVTGEISANGEVCATAEATFIRPADGANLAIKSR
ncbi:hypothetical protein BH10ACT2_BH10ACT2_15820 [soil metagenome]